jgi:hypothetical protein
MKDETAEPEIIATSSFRFLTSFFLITRPPAARLPAGAPLP